MKRDPWILAGGAMVFLLLAALAYPPWREPLARFDAREWVAAIGEIGPVPFFCALALLPTFWFPVSPFLVLAGAIYPIEIAIAGSLTALVGNMALTWLLSGWWLRPFFDRMAARMGKSPPRLTRGNMVRVALLIRLAPGIPFALQNYLLGLARMPFAWYIGVSFPPVFGYSLGFIVFGEALLRGEAVWILAGFAFLFALAWGGRVLRGRLKDHRMESSTL